MTIYIKQTKATLTKELTIIANYTEVPVLPLESTSLIGTEDIVITGNSYFDKTEWNQVEYAKQILRVGSYGEESKTRPPTNYQDLYHERLSPTVLLYEWLNQRNFFHFDYNSQKRVELFLNLIQMYHAYKTEDPLFVSAVGLHYSLEENSVHWWSVLANNEASPFSTLNYLIHSRGKQVYDYCMDLANKPNRVSYFHTNSKVLVGVTYNERYNNELAHLLMTSMKQADNESGVVFLGSHSGKQDMFTIRAYGEVSAVAYGKLLTPSAKGKQHTAVCWLDNTVDMMASAINNTLQLF